MNEEISKEPRERMRDIAAHANDDDERIPKYEHKPEAESPQAPMAPEKQAEESILTKLPQLKPTMPMPPQVETKAEAPRTETPKPVAPALPPADLSKLPQKKPPEQPKLEPEQPPVKQSVRQADKPQKKQDMPRKEKLLRSLWTTTSVISMTVNIIVVIVLLMALWFLRGYRLPPEIDIMVLNRLLSGLYSNFEKMDRATIQTVIPVDAQIPLDISVPVQTTTQITLAETVVIPNAQVVINTGGLNINSNARVTLPAGTPLNVDLNFELPVQTSIPVHLEVPVNIPMAETELHEPFVGLQEVVKPLYCLLEPAAASSISGEPVCK